MALNCTRVQGLLMWDWSMNSLEGKITVVAAVLAWPAGWVRVALTAGLPERLVEPLKESFSLGV